MSAFSLSTILNSNQWCYAAKKVKTYFLLLWRKLIAVANYQVKAVFGKRRKADASKVNDTLGGSQKRSRLAQRENLQKTNISDRTRSMNSLLIMEIGQKKHSTDFITVASYLQTALVLFWRLLSSRPWTFQQTMVRREGGSVVKTPVLRPSFTSIAFGFAPVNNIVFCCCCQNNILYSRIFAFLQKIGFFARKKISINICLFNNINKSLLVEDRNELKCLDT